MLISVEMLAQFAVLCCENAVTLLLALAGRFCFGGGNASAVLWVVALVVMVVVFLGGGGGGAAAEI